MANNTPVPKVGDKVTTIYGEELEVLEVRTDESKTKKGVVVQENETFFLAQSGEQKCWFPLSYLGGKKNG